MIEQRGITIIELAMLFVYLAIIVSATAYGAKVHGALGMLVGFAGGASIPIGIYALLYSKKTAPAALVDRALPLLPFVVVGVYLLRPDVLLLQLAAVAAVLVVGDFLFQSIYARITSTGDADGFTLHFGHFLLVLVVGTVLAIWWGWRSTGIILAVDGAWQILAGLLDRKTFKGLPPGEE